MYMYIAVMYIYIYNITYVVYCSIIYIYVHIVIHIVHSFHVSNSSLQPLGLPAANPAYPLTFSNPFAEFKFFFFPKQQTPKP